jgi:hypothetical protein
VEPLRNQQPQYHQGRVDAVVELTAGFRLGQFEKFGGKQFLKAGRKTAQSGFRNKGRERWRLT